MGFNSWKTVTAGLAALALAASPAAAMQPKDYSRNGATGDFAPQQHLVKNYGQNGATGDFAPQQHLVKNYGQNGASGDFAPPVASQTPVVAPEAPATSGNSFAWGAALAGAGTTLLLVLALGGTLRIRRRTSSAPRVA
jgi:hypothetical protein